LTIIAVFYLEILDGDFVPYLAKPNDAWSAIFSSPLILM
jgi:hypothetical protein